MSDGKELIQAAIAQQKAINVAGEFLGRLATSKSSYADEAMAVLSHLAVASDRVHRLVTPKPTPLGGK